jgi:hypothetical protein
MQSAQQKLFKDSAAVGSAAMMAATLGAGLSIGILFWHGKTRS